MPPDHPNLATALAAFQGEMPTVLKSKRADVPTKTGGKFTYTYADLADVTEAAMPVLSKHGLSFLTKPRFTANGLELRGVLLHTSGESQKGSLPIRGSSPQEIGSSLTYMRRYLFGCLTGIVTEDDDDGAAAQKARKPRQAPAPPDDPERPSAAPPATQRMSRAARPNPPAEEPMTVAQRGMMLAAFNGAGITDRDQRLAYSANLIGRPLATSNELTKAEASRIIDALKTDALEPPDDPDELPLDPP